MIKSKLASVLLLGLTITITSCGDDDGGRPVVNIPESYDFVRNGSSTVFYDGQTTRIKMAEEIVEALKDETKSAQAIRAMFAHEEGNNDFSDADLNVSSKNVRSKVAASADYFSSNTVEAAAIKEDFDSWIMSQAAEVFPNWNVDAAPGIAGLIQEAGGGTSRYISGQGLELDQVFAKGLIGGLMVDQILNNYLSHVVLDAGDNVSNNSAGITEEGKNYTTMEHKWDEAFGYLYGASLNPTTANTTVGQDDDFLNEYLGKVNEDPDFSGIATEVYQAFILGRAAIVAGDYELRDEQADLIRNRLSKVIAVRAVHYLEAGAAGLSEPVPDQASIFHELSEAYGFVYSLQFARNPETNTPYFTRTEVIAFLADMMDDGANGLWDVEASTLKAISSQIATEFGFTVDQARE